MHLSLIYPGGDYSDALTVRERVFTIEQGVPRDIDLDEFDAQGFHVVLYEDKAPVGTGRLVMVEGVAKIGRLAVLRQYRGRGRGKMILRQLVAAARDAGKPEVFLHAQVSAVPFYMQFGFKETGGIFQEAGMDHIAMVLSFDDTGPTEANAPHRALLYFQGKLGEHVPEIACDVLIAPGATVVGQVKLATKANIWFNAVLRGDIEPIDVGPESNVQDNAVIHTDVGCPTVIGGGVTIGHGAIVHGAVVEDDALIGMGATVLSGAVIEAGAIIAAGALVPEGKVIAAGMLAVGVPAKILRPVSDHERKRVLEGVQSYVRQARRFIREGLSQV